MFKRIAAALSVAAIALSLVGCEQNQADVSELPRFESREVFAKYVREPESNALLFVWSQECKGCDKVEDILKQTAALRTDIKFYKVDASWTNLQVTHPYIAFVAPGVGILAQGNAESLDAVHKVTRFLNERVGGIKDILPLKKAAVDAKAALMAKYKVFKDREDGVRTKMITALKDQDQLLAQLRSQIDKEGRPFDEEIRAIEARKREALAGTQAKLDAALEKRDQIRLPFRLEIRAIQDEQDKGTAGLQDDLDKADEALSSALARHSAALKKQ